MISLIYKFIVPGYGLDGMLISEPFLWTNDSSLMSLGIFLKVVTCGNVPLESSFRRVPRCVYTSTSLYEYRAWGSKPANPKHRHFTWGLRSLDVSILKSFLFLCFDHWFVFKDLLDKVHAPNGCFVYGRKKCLKWWPS